MPGQADWGRFANHFGTAHKVFFITADTMSYDFGRIAPSSLRSSTAGRPGARLNDSRKTTEPWRPAAGWSGMISTARCRGLRCARRSRGRGSPSRWCMSRGRRWRSAQGKRADRAA